jgi:hypothetical protein
MPLSVSVNVAALASKVGDARNGRKRRDEIAVDARIFGPAKKKLDAKVGATVQSRTTDPEAENAPIVELALFIV